MEGFQNKIFGQESTHSNGKFFEKFIGAVQKLCGQDFDHF